MIIILFRLLKHRLLLILLPFFLRAVQAGAFILCADGVGADFELFRAVFYRLEGFCSESITLLTYVKSGTAPTSFVKRVASINHRKAKRT